MIAVDVKNKFTGKLKRRYLCKSYNAVNRLRRKFKNKFWIALEVDDYETESMV